MATPPEKFSLRKQDFPSNGISDQDSLDKLFGPLNTFSDQVASALSQSLTLTENFRSEVKSITIQTPSSGTGVLSCFPLTFKTTVSNPQAVLLASVQDRDTTAAALTLGVPHWDYQGKGIIRLRNLPGLALSRSYQVTLLVLGG